MINGPLPAGLVVILLSLVGKGAVVENSWYFTAEQIAIAYRYQENFGQRLRNPVKPHDCYRGKNEFVASFRGKEFLAPCQFIHQTTLHLKTMLENGMARYLFPLDADHAHLALPLHLWRDIYRDLNPDQLLRRVLRDPALVALYHTAEHLAATGPKHAPLNPSVKKWKAQRNVFGFYDGRPIEVLPPRHDGSGYQRIRNHQTIGGFFFLAHHLADLTIVASGQPHSFDLSFDDDLAHTEAAHVEP